MTKDRKHLMLEKLVNVVSNHITFQEPTIFLFLKPTQKGLFNQISDNYFPQVHSQLQLLRHQVIDKSVGHHFK